MYSRPLVSVLDGDMTTREAVRRIAQDMKLTCREYGTSQDFLRDFDPRQPGCLVLEMRLPDTSGLQVQQELHSMGASTPLLFLSAQQHVSLAVEVVRRGALNYLLKPPRASELWNAIEEAIARDRQQRELRENEKAFTEALKQLTQRERDTLRLLADGASKKKIVEKLGVSLRTVELDSSRIMRKLNLKSPNALLHFALLAHPDGLYSSLLGRFGETRAESNDFARTHACASPRQWLSPAFAH